MDTDRGAALAALLTGTFRATRSATLALGDLKASAPRHILATLDADGPMRVRDVAEALRIAPPSVAHAAEALEHQGYVERYASPDCDGCTMLRVTPDGSAANRDWYARVVEALSDALADASPEDWDAVARTADLLASLDHEALRASTPPHDGHRGPRAV
ncbi:MarR family winged helix-turn-helix transcriptional regulator [Demequina gelatinilytica]|uniref:MarR family winged helix-turn-helix transcriptional regulator n=1 Tax=Demequina gelatinilytica TaxID=1638980 RepID=UPI0007828019|nr:MarR family transcriptional regulator [Demequina gelatinilytica]